MYELVVRNKIIKLGTIRKSGSEKNSRKNGRSSEIAKII